MLSEFPELERTFAGNLFKDPAEVELIGISDQVHRLNVFNNML
jgi:hypothetical protein